MLDNLAVAGFAVRLLLGMAIATCGLPAERVPGGYFRVQFLVMLGLAVVVTLTDSSLRTASAVTAALCYVGSILWLLERRPQGRALLGLVLLGALSLALLQRPGTTESTGAGLASLGWLGAWGTWGVGFLGLLMSAATLGSTMTAMLLGHRYLTAPGMPLAPLQRLNTYVGVAGLLRGVVSAGVLAMVWNSLDVSSATIASWLALRWLAGVVGPLVVWFLVRQILTFRNTQSATGVLFVGVILAFIGELTALLLTRQTGFPL